MTVNQIYKAASPGVVDIIVTARARAPGSSFFGGGGGSQQTQGEGAGVVYNTKGDILTDEHVVAGRHLGQGQLPGRQELPGQGGRHRPVDRRRRDPRQRARARSCTRSRSPTPTQAQVGDPVVAIGSPFSLPETTTTGIVSQTGRSITAPNNYTIPNAIQTDAAINPGNSGGPLLDASGHVLGLNDQIETNNPTAGGEGSSSGVGFAIPSNTVAQIADQIIGGQQVKHAYVGVSLSRHLGRRRRRSPRSSRDTPGAGGGPEGR